MVIDLEARLAEGEEAENKSAVGTFYGRKLAIDRRCVCGGVSDIG